MYDSGHIAEIESLKSLMEYEKLLRPTSEIDTMILHNNANDNETLKGILHSQKDYIVDYKVIQEPEPEPGNEVKHLPVDDAVIDALMEVQIKKLYKFQEEAVKAFLGGKDVVVVAPTASGKTKAFCVPVLQKIIEELSVFGSPKSKIRAKRKVFAIFVYPTKALARDQLSKIRQLAEPLGIHANIFDGDTTSKQRDSTLSSPPEIIITNFDVLHYHLLNRTKFSYLISDAGFLIVDEAHIYTGIFGANVHYIIRRLERISRNKKLQIIATSATLPNAEEFCTSLFGRKMNIVYGKGRRGKINFIILFPSFHSRRSLMIDLVRQIVTHNHKTIAFNKSHLGSELLAFYLFKQGLKIKVHRAGLLPTERKIVEQSFRNGQLTAISATPTLELGIDIGDVDAIVSDIVPINRLIQRVGRAARSGQEGYAFLVLGNDPISQYYKSHPSDYMADQELAYTDPSNPFVEEHQVLAMACDRPILMTESSTIVNIIQRLTSKGLLHMSNGKFLPNFDKAMSVLRDFSIRGIGTGTDILFNGKLIGERSLPQALEELHDNAIYFLSGKRYQVKKLHFDPKKERRSYAELTRIPDDYPYYTKSIVDESPNVLSIYEYKRAIGIEVKYCSLKIQKRVLGYSNIEIGQEVPKGAKVMFEDPVEFQFITKGLVFRAPRPVNTLKNAKDEQYVEMSGYHASEHVMIEGSYRYYIVITLAYNTQYTILLFLFFEPPYYSFLIAHPREVIPTQELD